MPDMKMLGDTFRNMPVKRPRYADIIQHILLDKGYDYIVVYKSIRRRRYVGHVGQRSNSPLPQRKRSPGRRRARRWVVERTHRWMNRFRRILTRWEKKIENYAGLLYLVCGIIAFRAAGVLG